MYQANKVASFTGAWIETGIGPDDLLNFESHPLRVRGLKLSRLWSFVPEKESHPLRVRGLKRQWMVLLMRRLLSHPLRVRGLKPPIGECFTSDNSRILYGCVDWNCICVAFSCLSIGRILYGCVDWNLLIGLIVLRLKSRILYGCVDWNYRNNTIFALIQSRILYGCVDWNLDICTPALR